MSNILIAKINVFSLLLRAKKTRPGGRPGLTDGSYRDKILLIMILNAKLSPALPLPSGLTGRIQRYSIITLSKKGDKKFYHKRLKVVLPLTVLMITESNEPATCMAIYLTVGVGQWSMIIGRPGPQCDTSIETIHMCSARVCHREKCWRKVWEDCDT